MKRLGLCLEPLDVLFFRDGRPFAATARVASGLPLPQVLAGAVRTALLEESGCDFAALRSLRTSRPEQSFAELLPTSLRWIAAVRFRGPWLCRLPNRTDGSVPDVFLPVPATLMTAKKGEVRPDTPPLQLLRPLPAGALPGWSDERGLRPLWPESPGTGAIEPASGFLDSAGLAEFLAGGKPAAERIHASDTFYGFDTRTGITIKPDELTTGDGEIYGIRFLALRPGIGFYAEVMLPEEAPADPLGGIRFLAFGGEGKRVAVHRVEPFTFPPYRPQPGRKSFVMLTTPAVANPDGTPYYPPGCVAAAVNTPVALSGWDLARGGPKPTRFASPAGSVYYLETSDPVPEPDDEFGYGCHLQGVWTDE